MNAVTQHEAGPLMLVEPDEPERRQIAERQPQSLAVPESSPAGMMLALMSRGASLEQIEKMMDLHERGERREAEKAFREDFAAFRGENIIIPKTKEVDRGRGGSFIQAEYDQVCGRLSPALSRHGFGFRHDQRFGVRRMMHEGVESDVGWVWVTCDLEHRKGHTEKLELEGPPGDLSVNTPTQNMQTTASYLKRQSLLSITGTATGGEDDESRMRGRAAGDDASADPAATALAEGNAAADKGMKALTEWWAGLSAKQRAALSKDFGQMRKHAGDVDREAGRA
jgi:hypothetical protein